MTEIPVDIVVIGAGAAGFMTAIWAGRTVQAAHVSRDILLLDSQWKIGAKILMSGGTRCNVTNQEVRPSDFKGGPSHFVKHAFKIFTTQETIQFFKEIGVTLCLEPSGKYFPSTHNAQTVLSALMKEIERVGVTLKRGVRITKIKRVGDIFHLRTEAGNDQVLARKVVVTTGGLSHPTTGSDGRGYTIAKNFGHTIERTFPALTPLLTNDNDWKRLSGISLETKLSYFENEAKKCDYRGAFLFTHFGFSGPAALNVSRHFASAKTEDEPHIVVNFLPQHNDESLKKSFRDAWKKSPKRYIKNILTEEHLLPARFVEMFLEKIGVDRKQQIGVLRREHWKQLIRMLLSYPLEVSGVFGYQKAEVTAGGVCLKEINVSTMESKKMNGLYFAGEVMDVDGRIGGFNFQWAWTTGAIAGRSAARSLTS
jgi:predicted Rossmann fold flavoprotein